ncbi:hypothetical protein, partial [Thermus scotoductus]|uniref:hypothetical protein n=1 Tax=Thermus scotoductus TaxID=37636 RepID=UPI0020A50E9D
VRIGLPKRGPDGKPVLNEKGEPEIAWQPKLAASCVTAVADGMAVDTLSEVVGEVEVGEVELTPLKEAVERKKDINRSLLALSRILAL